MTQYSNFFDAYMNKNRNVAADQWVNPQPGNNGLPGLQQLANAYSSLNPTWKPPDEMNAALPNPIQPVTFDPMGDVGYAAAYNQTQTANQHAQAERDYQYGVGAQTYGINAQGQFDSTNPYAQAAVMKKRYDESVRGTNNSYAAAGQLYAGSRVNAQNTNDYSYGLGMDQLKRAAQGFYHGQDLNVQNVSDAGLAQLAALLGPAHAAFLQQQGGP